ncbi:MAG: PilT/PilU family type 4a pilus ATPase [Sedimentisphaerales bacterium]|nr:PilT/PilU family type 4a pilus ATPase [Sedimentisphaerales bacterium]
MSNANLINTPVYTVSADRVLSMRDLLNFFYEHGSLRVSDLHLKANNTPTYRIDGQLQPMNGPPLDSQTVEALARTLISDGEWEMLIKNRAVDSSYITDTMQFRINTFYDSHGLAVAIRALEPDPVPLEKIGFPNRVWHDIVNHQWGLVLVTGITGSGKSTTISSMINHISKIRPCRIITLEDPIEYRLTSDKALISQREVGRDVPGFAHGIRDCLREDPDVIFVGEMRDRESAAWTLTAAETGHLVFSTLHTRDVRGTITRLLDMFPSDQQDEVSNQLSLGLRYILCQKLIPRADGQGRAVAMEVLNNSYALGNLIRLRKMEQIYSFLQTRTKDVPEERMITLERSLAQLVLDNVIEPLEAEKWANHPQTFLDEMKNVQQKIKNKPKNQPDRAK